MRVGDWIINMQNGYRGMVTVVYATNGRPRHVQFLERTPGGEVLRYLPVTDVELDPEVQIH